MRLWYPSTVMSEPWTKSKNPTKIYPKPALLQNQLVITYYLTALPKVTFCPTNVNHCIMFFRKTLVSLDPVLLTSPVPPSSNTISILATLNPSNRERTAPATTIIRKSKSKCRKCYRMALSNLVLVPGPALLRWLKKIKYYDSIQTTGALIKPLSKTVIFTPHPRYLRHVIW